MFPNLKRADTANLNMVSFSDFVANQCLFSEDFSELRQGFSVVMERYLSNPVVPLANERLVISDMNVNSILQLIISNASNVRSKKALLKSKR